MRQTGVYTSHQLSFITTGTQVTFFFINGFRPIISRIKKNSPRFIKYFSLQSTLYFFIQKPLFWTFYFKIGGSYMLRSLFELPMKYPTRKHMKQTEKTLINLLKVSSGKTQHHRKFFIQTNKKEMMFFFHIGKKSSQSLTDYYKL